MAVKKNSYVDFELEWLQEKADQLKTYVDNNPFHELVDRLAWKSTANGGQMPLVVATIEAQIKSLTQALKDYAQIIEVIDKLREKEEQKAEARGSQEINGKMKQFN
jgi:hypothetical protein